MSYQEIRNAARTMIDNTISGYTEMANAFDIEQNTDRELSKGYVVYWGESTNVTGPTRKVAFNASLNVVLTNSVAVRVTDDVAPQIDTLYADIELIIRKFLNDQFLGIPTIIRGVKAPYISNNAYL